MVSPYIEAHLNPASLDVTLGGTILIEQTGTRDLLPVDIEHHTPDAPYWLKPGEWFLAETREIFNIPTHLGAQFVLKSSRAREGFDHAEAGFADPGWFGSRLTMELRNNRRLNALPIWPGLRIGQMKFILISGEPERSYAQTGRYNAHLSVMPSLG